ncbi:TRAP transporter small permease [Pararhizobium haloflavum]|uniref:TRAP transporter small permease n=1 Tax=Pararhizobium haloflavum TaxID=2037914 RepID=UPI000C1A2F84|nr:TRAP transporter small permease subunit [Pararhizobium haloflavum]
MVSLARLIGKAMTFVSIALMIVLSLPIAYEAIARSFGAPTIWVFETTLYAFVFLGFLGNVLAVQTGAHFRVTLLPDIFHETRWLFDLIAQLATLAFAALLIGAGIYFVWYQLQNEIVSATLLEVPLWIPGLAMPLGGIGLFLQTLVQMITGEIVADAHLVSGD